ncbi:hypothetical protein LIS04_171 [Listeria phage LIS04]|nr:hypothetical protein LIS04_171 [Listeria phage LIS04]
MVRIILLSTILLTLRLIPHLFYSISPRGGFMPTTITE